MGIYIFLSIIIIIACFLQVMIVLVQNSKGGGLAANFTSAGQSMGIRKTADFLEKSTWTLAGAILIMCVVATATIPRGSTTERSRIENSIQNAVDPNAIPTLPTAVPTEPSPAPSGNEQQPQN
jgi:preprotein translocase subunit SecG